MALRKRNPPEAGAAAPELDAADNSGQPSRTGQVSEADLMLEVSRNVAKRLGWTPKEEWNRDPEKWVDAPQFLDQAPAQFEALKESRKRTAQAAAAAIEEARRQARIEAEAEIRTAAATGDADAAARAAEKLAQASGPPPQTVAWLSRNPWFHADPLARTLAQAEVNRLAAGGASIEDQLEGAEATVRKRFPEHFADEHRQAEPAREVPLANVRAPAPAVSGGSRAALPPSTKVKGFGDIPVSDQALYRKHFARRFEGQGLNKEAAEAKYADAYWANKGG
jgi:hypothetical protein